MPQDNWRWCRNCSVLFFGGGTGGKCPKTGHAHDSSGSGNYVIDDGENVGQDGWRWCSHCQQLHYSLKQGHCGATKGRHDSSGSSAYSLYTDTVPHGCQGGWKWCSRCQSLWYPEAGGNRCSAGGFLSHDQSGSGDYALRVDQRL